MSDLSKSKITKVHDKAFRHAMSDLRVARDFLEHYLPSAIKEKIDFSSLTLCKESYVDEALQELITDVLYSMRLKDKECSSAFIYFLLEHLSVPQKLAPWRKLRYTCRIIDQYLQENDGNQLPLVIPIVVYNGRTKYPYSTSIYDLFNESERELARNYMFTQFQLIDFTQISDEEMRTHPWSNLMEILLKHAFSRDIMTYLEGLSTEIKELAHKNSDSYILAMLKYVIECSETRDDKRFKVFLHKSLPKPLEQEAMTLAQLWEERGLQKGLQEGARQTRYDIAKELLKTLTDIELICRVTGLNKEEIKQLRVN